MVNTGYVKNDTLSLLPERCTIGTASPCLCVAAHTNQGTFSGPSAHAALKTAAVCRRRGPSSTFWESSGAGGRLTSCRGLYKRIHCGDLGSPRSGGLTSCRLTKIIGELWGGGKEVCKWGELNWQWGEESRVRDGKDWLESEGEHDSELRVGRTSQPSCCTIPPPPSHNHKPVHGHEFAMQWCLAKRLTQRTSLCVELRAKKNVGTKALVFCQTKHRIWLVFGKKSHRFALKSN